MCLYLLEHIRRRLANEAGAKKGAACGKKTLGQRKFHKEEFCKEAKYGLPEGGQGRPKSRN